MCLCRHRTHNLGTRRGWVVSTTLLLLYPRDSPSVAIGADLEEHGKSRPHQDSISVHPARNESLHRTRYPGRQTVDGQ